MSSNDASSSRTQRGFVGTAETDAGLLGELDVHGGVRAADRRRLGPRDELLAAELAQRLELAVAARPPDALAR